MILRSKRLSDTVAGIVFEPRPRSGRPYEAKYLFPGDYAFTNKVMAGQKFVFLVADTTPLCLGLLCGFLQGKGIQYLYHSAGIGGYHAIGVGFGGNTKAFDFNVSRAFTECVVW